MAVNCQSLNYFAQHEIHQLIVKYKVSILFMQEIWHNSMKQIPDFDFFPNYRQCETHGGGTAILAHKRLHMKPNAARSLQSSGPGALEYQWCEYDDVVYISIYLPPRYVFTLATELDNELSTLFSKLIGIQFMMAGDFNIDPVRDDREFLLLSNYVTAIGARFVIPSTSTRDNRTLDYFITTFDSLAMVDVHSMLSSDHDAIFADAQIIIPPLHIMRRPLVKFRKLSEEKKHELSKQLLVSKNLDYGELYSIYLRHFNTWYPEQKVFLKQHHFFPFNDKLRNLLDDRNRARKYSRRSPRALAEYKRLRRICKREFKYTLKRSIQEQFELCLTEADRYKLLKRLTPSTKQPTLLDPSKADEYLDYFINITESIASKKQQKDVYTPTIAFSSIETSPLMSSTGSILRGLEMMNKRGAPGKDGIPPWFMKVLIEAFPKVTNAALQLSIEKCDFPSSLKDTIITPIPKGICTDSISEHRPISLLNCFSKPFERIMYDHLDSMIDKHLEGNQFGFRRNRSSISALSLVSEHILESTRKLHTGILVLLDFSKAFDSLRHDFILKKLEHLGLCNKSLQLFQSFLSQRSQQLKIQQTLSTSEFLKRGVPQGSILGPLLFNVFVADLPTSIRSGKVIQYADDTQIFYSISNTSQYDDISADMTRLMAWCSANELFLNTTKSKVLYFPGKVDPIPISIDGTELEQVETARNLGLFMDSKMKFEKHIDAWCSRTIPKMIRFSKISPLLTFKLRKQFLQSTLIYPMMYGSPVYYPHVTKRALQKLQKLQNWAARLLYLKKPKFRGTSELITKARWVRIADLARVNFAVHCYQAATGFLGPQMQSYFNHSTRPTRIGSSKIYIVPSLSSCHKKSIALLGPLILNELQPLVTERCGIEYPDHQKFRHTLLDIFRD